MRDFLGGFDMKLIAHGLNRGLFGFSILGLYPTEINVLMVFEDIDHRYNIV